MSSWFGVDDADETNHLLFMEDIDLGDDIDDVVLDDEETSLEGEISFVPSNQDASEELVKHSLQFMQGFSVYEYEEEEEEIIFTKGIPSWRRRLLICALIMTIVTTTIAAVFIVGTIQDGGKGDESINSSQKGDEGEGMGQIDDRIWGPTLPPTTQPVESCNEEFSVQVTDIFAGCQNSPEAEGAHNALDDKSSTKFLLFTDRHCRDFSLRWKMLPAKYDDTERYTIQRYVITTAADAEQYPERNPHTWLLQGRERRRRSSNGSSGKWVTFDNVNDPRALPSAGNVRVSFIPDHPPPGRFDEVRILFNHEGKALQIADITLDIYYPDVICEDSSRAGGPSLRPPPAVSHNATSTAEDDKDDEPSEEKPSEDEDRIAQWIHWLALQNPSLDMSVLMHPTSSQHKAISWLATKSGVPPPGLEHESTHTDAWYIDRFALATLYYTTGGPSWRLFADSFLEDMITCSSSELKCSEHGDILGVEFDWFLGSEGHIATEIGMMKHLQTLDLSKTGFLRGKIPTEIAAIATLETLVLSNPGAPSLTGTIPFELGNLSNLKHLDLRKCNCCQINFILVDSL